MPERIVFTDLRGRRTVKSGACADLWRGVLRLGDSVILTEELEVVGAMTRERDRSEDDREIRHPFE